MSTGQIREPIRTCVKETNTDSHHFIVEPSQPSRDASGQERIGKGHATCTESKILSGAHQWKMEGNEGFGTMNSTRLRLEPLTSRHEGGKTMVT